MIRLPVPAFGRGPRAFGTRTPLGRGASSLLFSADFGNSAGWASAAYARGPLILSFHAAVLLPLVHLAL